MSTREEVAAGFSLLQEILTSTGLKLRESKRPWPDRMATMC